MLGAGIALCAFSLWAMARHDLLRLLRPGRRVMAQVTGHRCGFSDSTKIYAAIYAFSDETGRHEAIDQVYSGAPRPAVGTLIEVTYPEGRPDLARPPRPLLWWVVYGAIGYGMAVLVAKAAGLIGD